MTSDPNWRNSYFHHLKLGMAGVLLAAIGAGIAYFLGDDFGPDNFWAFLAVAVLLTGLGIGFVHLGRAQRIFLSELRRRTSRPN